MNPILETPKPHVARAAIKNILSKNGIVSSLITIERSDLLSCDGSSIAHQQMLFVIEGEVTVGIDEVNTILKKEDALLVPTGENYSISTGATAAKLLKVVIPLPLVKDPPVHSFAS